MARAGRGIAGAYCAVSWVVAARMAARQLGQPRMRRGGSSVLVRFPRADGSRRPAVCARLKTAGKRAGTRR